LFFDFPVFLGVEGLRRIGQVIQISPSGKAVIKAEMKPRIGSVVTDERNRQVGKVFDIIGPTISPYVEVDLNINNPHALIGRYLYFSYSRRQKKWSENDE